MTFIGDAVWANPRKPTNPTSGDQATSAASMPSGRFYDAEWAKQAREFKRLHPFCLGCAAIGERSATTIVDHVVPHRGDRAKFGDPNNRQPACDWHRSRRAQSTGPKGPVKRVEIGALRLDSPQAIALTRRKRPVPVAIDGWVTQGSRNPCGRGSGYRIGQPRTKT